MKTHYTGAETAGGGNTISESGGTTGVGALQGGSVDGGIATNSVWGTPSAAELADATAAINEDKPGSTRNFNNYVNNNQQVIRIGQGNEVLAIAANNHPAFVTNYALLEMDESTGALYYVPTMSNATAAAAGISVCPIGETPVYGQTGTGTSDSGNTLPDPGTFDPTDANYCTSFGFDNNGCQNYAECQADPNPSACVANMCKVATGMTIGQKDGGSASPSCATLSAECCTTSCKPDSPGCYTADQKIERGFGDYVAVGEPVSAEGLSIVSLDKSSTLGQLNYKQSQIAFFTADIAPTAQPMREFKTDCGTDLKLTPGHTLVALDGSVKFASSYVPGDFLIAEDGSLCSITSIRDFDQQNGNQQTFQAFNVTVDSSDLTEQVIVTRGDGHGKGILTGSHWFQAHDLERFNRFLARETLKKEMKL